MFGNALLFLSNPFFNECFRVDAVKTFKISFVEGEAEKFKTFQGYLFDEEGKQMFDFEPLQFLHVDFNECRDRCLVINESDGQQLLDVMFSSVEIRDYFLEVFKYLEGLRTASNLNSIYTIYFD